MCPSLVCRFLDWALDARGYRDSGVYNTPHSHEYGCSVIKEVLWKGIVLFFILMFDAELSIQMIMLH